MYNRYIRNDQGTYTRIPEEEPRRAQGGTSFRSAGTPAIRRRAALPHWDSAPRPALILPLRREWAGQPQLTCSGICWTSFT